MARPAHAPGALAANSPWCVPRRWDSGGCGSCGTASDGVHIRCTPTTGHPAQAFGRRKWPARPWPEGCSVGVRAGTRGRADAAQRPMWPSRRVAQNGVKPASRSSGSIPSTGLNCGLIKCKSHLSYDATLPQPQRFEIAVRYVSIELNAV